MPNKGVITSTADGVGGWADSGVDPKLYAASLMQNAKAAVNIKVSCPVVSKLNRNKTTSN